MVRKGLFSQTKEERLMKRIKDEKKRMEIKDKVRGCGVKWQE